MTQSDGNQAREDRTPRQERAARDAPPGFVARLIVIVAGGGLSAVLGYHWLNQFIEGAPGGIALPLGVVAWIVVGIAIWQLAVLFGDPTGG